MAKDGEYKKSPITSQEYNSSWEESQQEGRLANIDKNELWIHYEWIHYEWNKNFRKRRKRDPEISQGSEKEKYVTRKWTDGSKYKKRTIRENCKEEWCCNQRYNHRTQTINSSKICWFLQKLKIDVKLKGVGKIGDKTF